MRRLTAPKISCLMYNVRLPFLPGSTSALVAVFLAGLTFGIKLFPFVSFSYFSSWLFFYFYLFLVFWSFVSCLFLFCLFGLFFGLWCLQLCWMVDQAYCCSCWVLWFNHPPFASSTCSFCFSLLPLSRFLYFFRGF